MKKSFAATAAGAALLLAGTAASLAADLPVRAQPVPAPIWNWTGFYVGGNVGATWGNNNDVNVVSVGVFNPPGFNPDIMNQAALGATTRLPNGNNARFIGGAQIGYNWQAANWLFGIEADIQGIANNNNNNNLAVTSVLANNGLPIITTLNGSQRIDYLGTVRGRLGFLATPTFLLYGTGGLAYGQVNSAINITQSHAGANTFGSTTGIFSQNRAGWTAGGGGEWLFAPNWSAKFEYLYYDLGNESNNAGILSAAFSNGFVRYAILPTVSTHLTGNIVRFGVNYHFNAGPAVVANY